MSLRLRSYEATTPRRKHSILKMLAFTAGIMVAVFVVVSIVSTNISISNYEQQYEDLVAQTSAVEDSNDEIRRYLDEDADMDEYIEDMARASWFRYAGRTCLLRCAGFWQIQKDPPRRKTTKHSGGGFKAAAFFTLSGFVTLTNP